MAEGIINRPIKYTNVNVGGATIPAKNFIDYNTGVVPKSSEFQAVVQAISWCYIMNAWVVDGHIMVTLTNPMDFEVTLPEWCTIRIFWL